MKNSSLFLYFWVFITLTILSFVDLQEEIFDVSLYEISLILIIGFIFSSVYNFLFLKLHILSIPQIYIIVTFCFTTGGVFMYVLGYEQAFYRFRWFDEYYLILAIKSVLLGLLSFQLGITCSYFRMLPKKITYSGEKHTEKNTLFFGMFIFIISLLIMLFTYDVVIATITSGYRGMHLMIKNNDFRLFSTTMNFLLPISSFMICANAKSKKQRIISYIAIVFTILIFLLSGGRNRTFGFLLSILVCLKLKGQKFDVKKILLMGICIIILIPIIKGYRGDFQYINPMEEMQISAPAYAFIEMGQSIQTLMMTIAVIPKIENYQYGSNYLKIFSNIIPNFGEKKSVVDRPKNLSRWISLHLDAKVEQTGGAGFLQISEFYSQFGYVGICIGYLLMGYVLVIWNRKCEMFQHNGAWIAMSTFTLFILLLWIRGEAAQLRYILWGVFIIFPGAKIFSLFQNK